MVERCDKCGKPFMDKSEVNRHKMYEHSVPVSPFEENKEGAVLYESINPQRKETGNREELQKSIITTTSNTLKNVDVSNKGENNNSNRNYNNSKGINISQNRSRGFRSIRM
jgi:hypothetical protein